jgi:hypothetical protein
MFEALCRFSAGLVLRNTHTITYAAASTPKLSGLLCWNGLFSDL